MGADEEGTHERLKALRRELVDPKIAEHHGRIFKTTGDGMLVEFSSVVDALRCATEVQAAMAERNVHVHVPPVVPDEGPVRFSDSYFLRRAPFCRFIRGCSPCGERRRKRAKLRRSLRFSGGFWSINLNRCSALASASGMVLDGAHACLGLLTIAIRFSFPCAAASW